MLDSKKSYVGLSCEIYGTGIKEADGRVAKILWQGKEAKGGLIFDVAVKNPKVKKPSPLCVKEANINILG